MADLDHPAWRTFIAELRSKGVEFPAVQFADEATRVEVLNGIGSLSVFDRAVVSSSWAKLAASSGGGGDSMSQAPASPIHGGARSGLSGGGNASTSAHRLYTYPSGQQLQSAASFGGGGGVAAAGDAAYSPLLAGTMSSASLGAPPRRFASPSHGSATSAAAPGASDPAALRSALARGDSTVALPVASDMLHSDPATLCTVLHEYLPHMGIEQIKSVLGLGAAGADVGTAADSTTAGFDSNGGAAGGPTINGRPVHPGTVLTVSSLGAEFGPAFSATSNGAYLAFPHTVKALDRIVVRAITDQV